MNKRQSKSMFYLSLLVSGSIFIQMGLYLTSLISGSNLRFNIFEVCHNTLKLIGLTSLTYAVDILVIGTFLFALWKIATQIIQTVKMRRRLQQYNCESLTNRFNNEYKNNDKNFMIISYPVPIAITIGFLSPKIILSTGLLNLLSEKELEAVIYHEMYHLDNHDPLKIFLMSISSITLPYIPILKWLNEKYRVVQEVMADELAIENQETSLHIGSALLKMLKVGKLETKSFAYASFAETSVNYRIEYMLNPLKSNQIKVPVKVAMWSVFVFSLISIFFIYALA
ncbi:M56 family metallopeptidase [Ureibacillus sinduriensis]|uniref:Peptidase M56 n=2 Tax=Ureibacillus sinduriensis TaxID=561440 RepID=A0A0A3HWZ1_9BACL|nr:M56 family metallopeptidase [Ureibacillus sinduriensis]KGR75735.1 peptidase M56 [Ureibacillus sinduriensis BLB-1 = JCM 15800]